jgi:hypothetical protein
MFMAATCGQLITFPLPSLQSADGYPSMANAALNLQCDIPVRRAGLSPGA